LQPRQLSDSRFATNPGNEVIDAAEMLVREFVTAFLIARAPDRSNPSVIHWLPRIAFRVSTDLKATFFWHIVGRDEHRLGVRSRS